VITGSSLDDALAAAARGWHVFPIKPDGKVPDSPNGQDDATTDRDQIMAWYQRKPGSNYGINCERSGLYAIDIDAGPGKQGLESWRTLLYEHGTVPTLAVRTPSGGWHLYYRHDYSQVRLTNTTSKLGEHVDTRGNGYVVGPGSVINGKPYELLDDREPAPLPMWIAAALRTDWQLVDVPTPSMPANDVIARVAELASELAAAADGQGNNTANTIAYMVGQYVGAGQITEVYGISELMIAIGGWTYKQRGDRAKMQRTSKGAIADGARDPRPWELNVSSALPEVKTPVAEGRRLKVTVATDIAMTATRWLWLEGRNHWLPMGALIGWAGREGVGKSTWTTRAIALVTTGKMPGDSYGTPKGVIVCSTEDDWSSTITPRLVAAGADLSRVYGVDVVHPDGLEDIVTLPSDLVEMKKIIRDKDVALVVLDPLLTFVNKHLDTHKDAEVRRALEPVTKMAHDTKASVIGLIHVNKTSEGDLMNRLMASRAIGAVVRGVLFCASYKPIDELADDDGVDPDEPKQPRFVFGQIKNNLGPKVMQAVEYHIDGMIVGFDDEAGKIIEGSYVITDGVIDENVEDIVLDQERLRRSAGGEGGKALAWLVDYLAGKGEVPSDQVIKAGEGVGHGRNAIQRSRAKLGDRIAVVNLPTMPRRTTWRFVTDSRDN
jgi:hypothetical protein